jgi:AcrR family transcriptional regulator
MPVQPTTARARPTGRWKGKGRGPAGSKSDEVYRAAEDLFFERGYGGTSLRDIADAVGLQAGSLYNHIDSKEQLLFDIMKASLDGVIAAVDEATAAVTDARRRLEAFMRATIAYYGRNVRESFIGTTELRSLPPDYRAEIQMLRDSYEQRLFAILQQCAADGMRIPNIRMAAYALVAISSHVASWYDEGGEMTLDEVADGLVKTYAPLAQRRATRSARAS